MDAIHNRTEPWIIDGWNYATAVEPRLLPLADDSLELGRQFPRRGVDPFVKSIKAKFLHLVGWGAAIDDERLKSSGCYSAVYYHLLHLYETAQLMSSQHRLPLAVKKTQVDPGEVAAIAWCERLGRALNTKKSDYRPKQRGRYNANRR